MITPYATVTDDDAGRPALASPLPRPVDLFPALHGTARSLRWARPGNVRAAALFLGVRLIGVAILAGMAALRGAPLLDRLTAWDGWWYLQVAEHGYTVPGVLDAAGAPYPDAPMAFFPLYPAFLATAEQLPGVDYVAAGLIVSTLAGLLASAALYRLGTRVAGPRVGLILVVLWAGAPMAITESMVYTESLFTALAAWALVGVLERNWSLAAAATVFAGLARSTACVLIVVVVAAAVLEAWRTRRWSPVAAAVIAPAGLAGYWGFVAARTGSLSGWQDIEQRGWNTRFDFGREAAEWITRTLLGDGGVFPTVVALLVLAAAALAALSARRMPWPLAAYAVGVVALVLASAGLPFAKVRFLLPGFTLLLPIALGLAGRRTSTTVAALAVYVLAGAWFSAYSLVVWQHAI